MKIIKNVRLLFLLGLVFSFGSVPVYAHVDDDKGGTEGGREASEVTVTDESHVREFLSHVKGHYDSFMESGGKTRDLGRKIAVISRNLRISEVYKTDEMYVILIDSAGTVLNHPAYPNFFGYKFNVDSTRKDMSPEKALKSLIEGSAGGNTVCEDYNYGGKTRVACATRGDFVVDNSMTIVVGLHHAEQKEEEEGVFSEPDCSSFPSLPVTAEDVYKNPTEAQLKAFVVSSIESYEQAVRAAVSELINKTDPDLSDVQSATRFSLALTQKISGMVACLTLGQFKHENIYLFVMKVTPDGTVTINGNNAALNGLTLELEDDQLEGPDKKIVTLFRNALTKGSGGEPEVGQFATVKYRWSDPERTDDKVDNWLETNKVPGTSPKTSYIEVMNPMSEAVKENPAFERSFSAVVDNVFGSGIYPKASAGMPAAEDDDDGCAIAGTDYSSSQSTPVNLLLTASVLLSVVFLRRRV